MMPGSKARWIAGGVIAVSLVLLYAFVDPGSHLFPRCIVLQLTGYQCPGCGSQRAVHALLTGDIAGAWRMNALLVAALPVLALMCVASWRKERCPRLYNALNGSVAVVIWAVLVVGWTLLRNF